MPKQTEPVDRTIRIRERRSKRRRRRRRMLKMLLVLGIVFFVIVLISGIFFMYSLDLGGPTDS